MESEIAEDLYYYGFHSDHYSLKSSTEYRLLMQTMAALETQHATALKDLEFLYDMKAKALKNPPEFISNLKNKKLPEFPSRQLIVKVPAIDLSNIEEVKDLPPTNSTSAAIARNFNANFSKRLAPSFDPSNHPPGSEPSKPKRAATSALDSAASSTFKQSWSAEEQAKLEQLLEKYPEEEVLSNRWKKIAKELGTRTHTQVFSRVQKYFIKLTKAGLPIPGKISAAHSSTSSPKEASLAVSFEGKEEVEEALPKESSNTGSTSADAEAENFALFEGKSKKSKTDTLAIQTENQPDLPLPPFVSQALKIDIKDNFKQSKEYQELVLLAQEKTRRKEEKQAQNICHAGYQCDSCGIEPIQGIRWTCKNCPEGNETDLCSPCHSKGTYSSQHHTKSHQFQKIDFEEAPYYGDTDYLQFEQGGGFSESMEYNYLDPNYNPGINRY